MTKAQQFPTRSIHAPYFLEVRLALHVGSANPALQSTTYLATVAIYAAIASPNTGLITTT